MARRKTEVFSMSFLDCITCAFGSVVLVYTLINAQGGLRAQTVDQTQRAEVSKMEEQVLEGYQRLVMLRNSLVQTDDERVRTEGMGTRVLSEMERLLCSGGQCIIALPLRGSFQEIADLFREYALKHDDSEFSKAVEAALLARPSIESLSEELEQVGLGDVDVEIRHTSLTFDSGRAFVEDPVSRLLILPEVKAWIGVEDVAKPLSYVRDAIDKYWSEGKLELSLNVGCASARKP